ncbi:hypothetical protein BDN71DRAFT_1441457 [Pleurotus eryngii]|uniref:Uncharacterized protein n=1 Tax=Pleurotus eryngii TaxID=5323 RepID=A0A9P6A6D4_PLEER|nr:hypothetical protein BDN71DRAFT_1441457 [Pleurotus eryngii]
MLATCLPQISISPAPPLEPEAEPYSPFAKSSFAVNDSDGFRPSHLTPPPTGSPRFVHQSSPLRPADAPQNKGLDTNRFEALLQATRERNQAKKESDLRKEVALKAHKHKQVERRALFLSKVMAPPSPTATALPKTPPESPAIFHCSLPSPGLVSPLAFFENFGSSPSSGIPSQESWVEQVDFRVRAGVVEPKRPEEPSQYNHLPSLDQISARMRYQKHVRSTSIESDHSSRLPLFLNQSRPQPVSVPERPRLVVGVGRLQMPLRAPQPAKATPAPIIPPVSPCSPLTPNLEVTTLVVPRSATTSPIQLSKTNLLALDSRSRRSSDMISTLRRRTRPSEYGHTGHDEEDSLKNRHWKRRSAPAELQTAERAGFKHYILSLPGAF